jgi:hypothetical protein
MSWGRSYRDTVDRYLDARGPADGTLALLDGAVGLAWVLIIVEVALAVGAWYLWRHALDGSDNVSVFAFLGSVLTAPSFAVVLWASSATALVRRARKRSVGHDSEALSGRGRRLLQRPARAIAWTSLACAVLLTFVLGWLLTTFP